MKLRFIVGSLILMSATMAMSDPSRNIGRLSYQSGTVSFLPAGESNWVNATLNRPLITGDQVFTDTNARVEVQLPLAVLRLNHQTNLKILELDDKISQFQVTEGTILLTVKQQNAGLPYEIDTPNLAFSLTKPGIYRFDISKDNNTTTVSVNQGQGVAYGQNAQNAIQMGQSCTVTGTNLDDFQCRSLGRDAFDEWNAQRNHRSLAAKSTVQRVSHKTIGYEDLESYGQWTEDPQYGSVWIPTGVDPNWAPYRQGHWIWLSTWGWTWVDEQPWGFAPFHYGRWAYINHHWCWVPGPVNVEPIYAPALVVFVGGNQFVINNGVSGVAWFPLAPGEIYVPAYAVSRAYFTEINITNTHVHRAYVERWYEHRHQNYLYRNGRIANAVTAVPTKAFVESKAVNRALVHVPPTLLNRAHQTQLNTVMPKSISVLGGAPAARAIPEHSITTRPVVTRTKPPAPPISFSQEQQILNRTGGRPLTASELRGPNATTGTVRPRPGIGRPMNVRQPETIQNPTVIHHQPITPSRTPMVQPHQTQPITRPNPPSVHPRPIEPMVNDSQVTSRPPVTPSPRVTRPVPGVRQENITPHPSVIQRQKVVPQQMPLQEPRVIHRPKSREKEEIQQESHEHKSEVQERALHPMPRVPEEMRPHVQHDHEREMR